MVLAPVLLADRQQKPQPNGVPLRRSPHPPPPPLQTLVPDAQPKPAVVMLTGQFRLAHSIPGWFESRVRRLDRRHALTRSIPTRHGSIRPLLFLANRLESPGH